MRSEVRAAEVSWPGSSAMTDWQARVADKYPTVFPFGTAETR